MDLHGVEENSLFRKGSMKFLYAELKKADRILNY